MPVFSVNTRCLFKVFFFQFVFIQVFCFVIPAHLFVLLCKEADLDIYEGFRCVSMHTTSAEFENVCGLFFFSPADEIMFQMVE